MKLFVIYIGGKTEKSLIELHDLRLVIAEKIEDTYDSLKKSWWGIPESLHLDCWGALKYADGYQVNVVRNEITQNESATSAPGGPSLYFVNLGGYSSQDFTELHKNIFVVADSEAAAKQKAVAQVREWEQPHKDHLFEAENIISVNEVVGEQNYSVALREGGTPHEFKFDFGYTPIGKMKK